VPLATRPGAHHRGAGHSSHSPNDALIARYLTERTDLRPLSRRSYASDLGSFAAFIEPTNLLEVGTGDIRAWIQASMRDTDDPEDPRVWSPRTMRRALSSVATFCRWARRRGLASLAPDIDMPPEPDRQAPSVPSHSDIERLFLDIEIQLRQTLDARQAELLILDAVVLRLCYNLGLRISEASGIQLSSISNVEGEVRVAIVTKGGKVRTFPVVGLVRSAWDRWLRVRARIVPVSGHEQHLFVHPWSGYRISNRRTWKRLRRQARISGIGRIHPHALRHARMRHLREKHADWLDLQGILGHARPDGVLDYVPEPVVEARRMDALRRSSEG
jgi:integrase/recombinase XerC